MNNRGKDVLIIFLILAGIVILFFGIPYAIMDARKGDPRFNGTGSTTVEINDSTFKSDTL